jgi:predicted DNA binding protein
MAEVSAAHPEATYRLLAGLVDGEAALEVGEVVADEAEAAARAVEDHPAVASYERLAGDDDRVLARYEVEDLALYGFLRAEGVPPAFPVTVEDGWFEVTLAASRERLAEVDQALGANPLEHEVLALVEDEGEEGALTDRQEEVMEAALTHGYLAVPRECTLEELAGELDADKSSVSGVLRRAQAELAERYVADRRLDLEG